MTNREDCNAFDGLTGMQNRAWGMKKLNSLVQSDQNFAFLLCDLDRFRNYNDCLGHHAGDEAIVLISLLIEDAVDDSGWVFRYAGDEFGVILPNTSRADAEAVAAKILANCSPQTSIHAPEGAMPTLSLSIGIAHFGADISSVDSLIYAADVALWKAKCGGERKDGTPFTGKNQLVVWGDFPDDVSNQNAQFPRDE